MKEELTNFEKDLKRRMKNKGFREAYEKERQKVIIAYKAIKQ